MKEFFKDFLGRHKNRIVFFSFLRILDFLQCLFLPYAFAKIVNIITQDLAHWPEASFWAVIFLVTSVTEDFIRLRGKLGLEKIASKLKVSLATFFTEKTQIKHGKKTGEAVQVIKKASEDIQELINFYKDNILQLPVNFIIIPLVLLGASPDYLFLLVGYTFLYLAIDFFAIQIYNQRLQKFFRAAEIFWGTTYRKTPDVWRNREDDGVFIQKMDQEGEALYRADVATMSVNSWRWILLQCLSSLTVGLSILLVLYKIVNNTAQIGDLVLVSSYFWKTQETLNMLTSTFSRIIKTKTSLKRLDQAVKIK